MAPRAYSLVLACGRSFVVVSVCLFVPLFVCSSVLLFVCRLHSFAGIGLGLSSAEELAEKILRRKSVVDRWRRAAVLLIDEISMVDASLFDTLEKGLLSLVAVAVRVSRDTEGSSRVIKGDRGYWCNFQLLV